MFFQWILFRALAVWCHCSTVVGAKTDVLWDQGYGTGRGGTPFVSAGSEPLARVTPYLPGNVLWVIFVWRSVANHPIGETDRNFFKQHESV